MQSLLTIGLYGFWLFSGKKKEMIWMWNNCHTCVLAPLHRNWSYFSWDHLEPCDSHPASWQKVNRFSWGNMEQCPLPNHPHISLSSFLPLFPSLRKKCSGWNTAIIEQKKQSIKQLKHSHDILLLEYRLFLASWLCHRCKAGWCYWLWGVSWCQRISTCNICTP